MGDKYKHLATAVVHAGQKPNPIHGAVVPGIELSTTYAQQSPGVHLGFEYSRTNNPTRAILQDLIAASENGKYCTTFASGSAATAMVVNSFVKSGDHIVSIDDVFGGTSRYFTKIGSASYKINVEMMDLQDTQVQRVYVLCNGTCVCHTHTRSHSRPRTYIHSHTYTHTLSHTLTHIHTLTHSHAHTLSHTHSHAYTQHTHVACVIWHGNAIDHT